MGKLKYEIEIEIFQGDRCDHHQLGETFKYPEDIGKLCPWLMDSVNTMVRILQFGGSLPWKYEGSAYEKVIDPKGITTEFVRCPDPTGAGVVAKISRKMRHSPKDIGWA
jgi:uncharacterized repeat protein (TIGR04076 family)